MTKPLNHIKLVAVDLDGPLLSDSFSPILHQICTSYGWEYTCEFERNTFSQPREVGAKYITDNYGDRLPEEIKKQTEQESLEGFFRTREAYLKANPMHIKEGAISFLKHILNMDVRLICYGGMHESYMKKELGDVSELFEQYICTNDFRPGLKEIIEIHQLDPSEVLFIDDVNTVATHAKQLGAAFIGVPLQASWSWQRQEMSDNGVPVIVDLLASITDDILKDIDIKIAKKNYW